MPTVTGRSVLQDFTNDDVKLFIIQDGKHFIVEYSDYDSITTFPYQSLRDAQTHAFELLANYADRLKMRIKNLKRTLESK